MEDEEEDADVRGTTTAKTKTKATATAMAKRGEVASEATTVARIAALSEAEETETPSMKHITNKKNLPNDDLPTRRTTNSTSVILEKSLGTRERILTFTGPTFTANVEEERTIVVDEVVVVVVPTSTMMVINVSGTTAKNMVNSATSLRLLMSAMEGASVIEVEDVDEEAGSTINNINVLDKVNKNLTLVMTLRLIRLLSLRGEEVEESKERRRCHR